MIFFEKPVPQRKLAIIIIFYLHNTKQERVVSIVDRRYRSTSREIKRNAKRQTLLSNEHTFAQPHYLH
jgi:hypothetical protein